MHKSLHTKSVPRKSHALQDLCITTICIMRMLTVTVMVQLCSSYGSHHGPIVMTLPWQPGMSQGSSWSSQFDRRGPIWMGWPDPAQSLSNHGLAIGNNSLHDWSGHALCWGQILHWQAAIIKYIIHWMLRVIGVVRPVGLPFVWAKYCAGRWSTPVGNHIQLDWKWELQIRLTQVSRRCLVPLHLQTSQCGDMLCRRCTLPTGIHNTIAGVQLLLHLACIMYTILSTVNLHMLFAI